ncbi:MAG: DUF445 domain-containing protein [Actinomycetota bacterium]|nr:DUF445 domain-containing protein [Actinomycetota bacterium]
MSHAAGAVAASDSQRRAGLRRMRLVALSLLIAAAVVYLLTLHRGGAWGYVHATAEASMVGAIADWFAVTALFRHPLGLPIPHTALIPTRKLVLARSLQDFVTENFLSEQVVRARVADAHVARRVAGWLAEGDHSARVVDEASVVVRAALLKVDNQEVAALVRDELLPRIAEEPLSVLAGQLLHEILVDGAHRGLVDLAFTEAHTWLVENPETVTQILSSRAPWWTPKWLDDRVVRRLRSEALAWVAEIRDDPDHAARRALDDLLVQLASDLQTDPDTIERAEGLKRRMLAQPQVLVAAMSLWDALRRAVVTALEDPESQLRKRAVAALEAFGGQVVADDELAHRLDAYVEDAVAYLVGRYGDELTTVITHTIDRWDGREAANRIELHVGRDLQFIRINGTIVGALVGLAIHTVTVLV